MLKSMILIRSTRVICAYNMDMTAHMHTNNRGKGTEVSTLCIYVFKYFFSRDHSTRCRAHVQYRSTLRMYMCAYHAVVQMFGRLESRIKNDQNRRVQLERIIAVTHSQLRGD